ncbi:uncharacterized protein NECHADRAFT_72635 [Fusarium vanettenii 77-13-4]|uniref:MYND-type zinc finger protein samB n=1 Tax=Fusarium vanettenii (strain ATCC MYA-4622 / CBS 123669 / FGSC 9596 / NRRL 45880 / 77-13-4) TaxID=660122 RepID=C7ZKI5_FUSV7|nr:uncharacterized protein NECHADRAFT_72635 [Fusarium vanettenii 77-13-4]EEU35412.1 hypothetical protein NECHADRAFT_72635 [Fusarium vanettenii 77-13-4]
MPRMNLGLPFQTCNVYPNPCKSTVQGAKLFRCSACHVVNYCGLEREEAALRANPGDANTPPDAFENAMGNFWTFQGTRRDQDAYDFIKWYAVKATSTYEWGNMELPFLDLKGENALEPVDEKPLHIDLSFFVALTLIKVRLMKDLMGLQAFVKKKPNATIAARMEYLKEEAMSDAVAEMRRQAMQLYEKVKTMNPHFWPGVLNPEIYAYSVPGMYTMGSPEEAVLVFRQSWYSWSETEAAIQWIRGIIRNDTS